MLRKEEILKVLENRALRRTSAPKREKVKGGLINLHNDEPHNLYSLLNITKVNKSRRCDWWGM
jgi:hypothetical protein